MEIIKDYRDIINALRRFLPKLSKAQIKCLCKIKDDLQLTIYLVSAYNVYEVTRHMERCYMISNPEKLDLSIFDVETFLEECRKFAFDALDIIERQNAKEKEKKEEKDNE